MSKSFIGMDIISILTESLYDKPIVIFREYVQNSVDSIKKIKKYDKLKKECRIITNNDNLYFLDNGEGIDEKQFKETMCSLANSDKNRISNIGYKGIGRLSGFPYCKKLSFINIVDYNKMIYQTFSMEWEKYDALRKNTNAGNMKFEDVMNSIGSFEEDDNIVIEAKNIIKENKELFATTNKGFLVILNNINTLLHRTIENSGFITNLSWLLPVDFKEQLLDKDLKYSSMFDDIKKAKKITKTLSIMPLEAFNISYNGIKIERPIMPKDMREYQCEVDLGYAIGFHAFNSDRFIIDHKNCFSGIKLYLDNVLLCDETELVSNLLQNGLIKGSANELIQSVKGLGAMIYITDKSSIFANARRTFIEVNEESIKLLERLAQFINNVVETRYALSFYSRVLKRDSKEENEIAIAKENAMKALKKLAQREIDLVYNPNNFSDLSDNEKVAMIKRKLKTCTNNYITEFLSSVSEIDENQYNNIEDTFLSWLCSTSK